MNIKITSIARLVLLAGLLSANSAFAVDDALVEQINNKASSANAKADGNNGRIGALELNHDSDIAAVYAAISAVELMPGPAGEDGADGAPGADGVDGAPGADGTDGNDGAPGADGTNGSDGAPGADGADGTNGSDGATGAPGADGTNGSDGATGAAGADGTDGTNGTNGSDGATGAPGADGTNGSDGAPGADGADGADGGGVPATATFGDVVYWNGGSWIATSGDKHQPSLGVNYIIATQGTFPSRSSDTPFLAEIIMFAGNFAPRGWAFCDGQMLPISQNTALFSLLGTVYGGDGRTTFGLPDLRGRVPVGPRTGPDLGPVTLGQRFGSDGH